MADEKEQISSLREKILNNEVTGSEAEYKADAISKLAIPEVKEVSFASKTYSIDILSMEKDGEFLVVLARAFTSSGDPIGFGDDGSVEYERFRIQNPPLLAYDPLGDIKIDVTRQDGTTEIRTYREDPLLALQQKLVQMIGSMAKKHVNSKIERGKIGNTTTSFTASVDGRCTNDDSTSWSSTRDDASCRICTAADSGVNVSTAVGSGFGPSFYYNNRAYFTFNTASIPDTDSVLNAYISGYVYSNTLSTYTSNTYVYLVPSTHTTVASAGQFGSITFTDYGNTNVVAFSTSAFGSFTLNATGRANVNKTGDTKLAMLAYHDFTNNPPTEGSDEFQGFEFYLTERTGTSQDPSFVVEHSNTPSPNLPSVNDTITITENVSLSVVDVIPVSLPGYGLVRRMLVLSN